MALVMMRTWLSCGNYPQADQAFTYLSTVASCRFNDIQFASKLASTRLELIERWQEGPLSPRTESVYYLFLGHIYSPMQDSVPILESALEIALQEGDRIWILLNFGLVATLKLFASEQLSDLEAFCTYGCEEVPHWQRDIRGGPMIVAARQVAKALQGKVSTVWAGRYKAQIPENGC